MGSVGVPSATEMPRSGLPQTHADADRMYATEMSLREKYSRPTDFAAPTFAAGSDDAAKYNAQPALPAKYTSDDIVKDRMNTKQAVIDGINANNAAAGAPAVVRTAPITEQEIDYVAQADREKQLASFDAYVQTLIDPRKPGNLQWLMEMYPDFVSRRIQQIHDDHDFALRNSLCDAFGINKFEDLMFKYHVDQGLITGPTLKRMEDPSEHFEPGALSFWQKAKKHDRSALPFQSATYGAVPDPNQHLNVPYAYDAKTFTNVAQRLLGGRVARPQPPGGGFVRGQPQVMGGAAQREAAQQFGLNARA